MPSYLDYRSNFRLQSVLALSPDGTEIGYTDDVIGQFNLVVQGITEGSGIKRLTSYVDNTVRSAAWHPTWKALAFTADKQGDEHTQIHMISVHGGEPEALTANPDAEYRLPAGSPFTLDGRLMAYTGNDRSVADQDVLVRDLATGHVRRIDAGCGEAEIGYWSPDGTRLSMVRMLGAMGSRWEQVPVVVKTSHRAMAVGHSRTSGCGSWVG